MTLLEVVTKLRTQVNATMGADLTTTRMLFTHYMDQFREDLKSIPTNQLINGLEGKDIVITSKILRKMLLQEISHRMAKK